MRNLVRATVAAAAMLFASAAQAQAPQNRVALVIGNAAYKESPLKNPVNDARAMTARLKQLGFEVILREDATRADMAQAVLDFAGKLKPGGEALFFYAGHGIQARGRNYLIPVDAALQTESAVQFAALDIGAVLGEMEQSGSRVSMVVLDACRNNPFERRMRGAARGLAAIDAARGSVIAYATAPGSVASDGEGDNGVYTAALLKALEEPGLKVEEVFKRVRTEVAQQTKNQQVPWESSSLTGDFVLNLSVSVAPKIAATGTADRDALFWSSIQTSQRPADFEAYLAQFPTGTFAALARNRLDDLKKPQVAALPPKPEIAIEPIDKPFIVTSAARLRDAPDLKGAVVATLKEGEPVHVFGKVKGQNWYQVEQKGKAPAYVASTLLADAAQAAAAPAPAKSPVQQAAVTPAPAPPSRSVTLDYDSALRRVADLARRTVSQLSSKPEDEDSRARRLSELGAALWWAGDKGGGNSLFDQAQSLALSITRSYDATWLKVSVLTSLAEQRADCGDTQGWRQTIDYALSFTGSIQPANDNSGYYRFRAPANSLLKGGDFDRAFNHADKSGNAEIRASIRDSAAGRFAYKDEKELSADDRQRALRWAQDALTIASGLCGGDKASLCSYIGKKLVRLGDLPGAARAVERTGSAEYKSDLEVDLARTLIKVGDKTRARGYLDEALRLARSIDAKYGTDDYRRGAVAAGYAALGDLAAVDAALQQMTREDKRQDAYSSIVYALIEAKNFAAAQGYIDRMQSPARAAALMVNIGYEQHKVGDTAAAKQNFARAAALAERETASDNHRYLIYAAKSLQEANEKAVAAKLLQKAVALAETEVDTDKHSSLVYSATTMRELGEMALNARLLARAHQLVDQIVDKDKRNSVGNYADNYSLAGNIDFALRVLDFMVEPDRRTGYLRITARALVQDREKTLKLAKQ